MHLDQGARQRVFHASKSRGVGHAVARRGPVMRATIGTASNDDQVFRVIFTQFCQRGLGRFAPLPQARQHRLVHEPKRDRINIREGCTHAYPEIGEVLGRGARAAQWNIVVGTIVMRIEQHAHAARFRRLHHLGNKPELCRVERTAHDRLQAFPAERQAQHVRAQIGKVADIARARIHEILEYGTGNLATIEFCSGQIDAAQGRLVQASGAGRHGNGHRCG